MTEDVAPKLDLDTRRQAARHFVGRTDDLRQIVLELDARVEKGAALIISISGVGGIGKTTLLRQALRLRRHQQTIPVFADDRDDLTDIATATRLLAGRLAESVGPLSHCARALIGDTTTTGAQVFAAAANTRPDDEIARLTDAFIRDVNDAWTTSRQVVLVLDGYEGARDVLGPWLLNVLLGGRLTPITGDLRLLVSGREPLQRTHLRWMHEWGDQIINIELEPFTSEETQEFLSTQLGGVPPTAADVEEAFRLTGGLPVWLALWRPSATLGGRSLDLASAETVQAVVDRFLMWWDNPLHVNWVRTAWVPRWFNQEILDVLLSGESTSAFEWLTRQAAIIFGERGRWRFHEVVRTALRREALQRAPQRLSDAHDLLAAYWRGRDGTEAVYHALLGGDRRAGLVLLCELYVRALLAGDGQAPVVAAALAARADSAAPAAIPEVDVIQAHWTAYQAGERAAEEKARFRLLSLELLPPAERAGLLAQQIRRDEPASAKAAVQSKPSAVNRWRWLRHWRRNQQPSVDDPRALALIEYGDSLRAAGDYPAAVAAFDEALALNPDDAQGRIGRGEALRALGRGSEALKDLTIAVRLAPTNVWAWALRGATYLMQDAFEEAYSDAARALSIDPQNAWALALRGLARCQIDQYPTPDAWADVRRALEINPALGWARTALEEWQALVASGVGRVDED